ncbi:MAG: hypothetical protein ABIJ48_00660 [Actinomycetota bacterium]
MPGSCLGDPLPVTYRLEWVGIETVEVAAGTSTDALHMQIVMTGESFEWMREGDEPVVSDMRLQGRLPDRVGRGRRHRGRPG